MIAIVPLIVPPEYHHELDAIERGGGPLRAFLSRHADARDRATFANLVARTGHPPRVDQLWVLAPAFLTAELREAVAVLRPQWSRLRLIPHLFSRENVAVRIVAL